MTDAELDDRLGELLVSSKALDASRVETARVYQQARGGTLAGAVLSLNLATDKVVRMLLEEIAGIKTVIIPDENAKDLTEIPDELKNALNILPVSRMEEVLKIAFSRSPQPIAWEEEGEEAGKIVPPKEETPAGVTAH